MRPLAVLAAALALAGCSFDEGGPGVRADGAVNAPDARLTDIDAAGPGTPDARPDATPVGCDGDDDCVAPPSLCLLPGTCDLAAGLCEFPPVDCSSLDGECTDGACNPATGACEAAPAHENQACGAGIMICGEFGECGDFADLCDESGTRARSCTDNTCQAGSCTQVAYQDTQSCTRPTEGTTCMSTECTPFSACSAFSSICDETGTQSRTCTEFKCRSSACTSGAVLQTTNCNRDTDGTTCLPPTCGTPTTCAGFSTMCDESGTQTRSCTPNRCVAGTCSPGTPFEETLTCSRDTEDDPCNLVCVGEDCISFCCDDGVCPVTPIGGNCPD